MTCRTLPPHECRGLSGAAETVCALRTNSNATTANRFFGVSCRIGLGHRVNDAVARSSQIPAPLTTPHPHLA